jgi:hypothetical protein
MRSASMMGVGLSIVVCGDCLVACTSADIASGEVPAIRRLEEPLCGLQGVSELGRDSVEMPEGHLDYQSWLAAERTQEQLPALHAVVELHRDRVLGVVPDHVAQEIVLVVDEPDAADLVIADLQASHLELPIRTQPACHPGSELRAVQAAFESRVWPEGTPAFASHLDVALGRYVMTLDSGSLPADYPNASLDTPPDPEIGRAELALSASSPARAVARDISSKFGALVDVRWGRAGARSRLNDGQPHFGAAGIGSANSNFCTAGFVVKRNGALGAVTAGHCFPQNGTAITSGTQTYGVSAGLAPTPTFDMTRIDPSGQQFSATIHTDPGAPVKRTQVAKKDPVFLDLVCVSGSVTGAKCAIEVLDSTCSIFNPGIGTTSGLTRGVRQGVTIGQDGDSGAPVYKQSGSTGAIIIGMESGGANFDEICFHTVSAIEQQLGVTVAL